ncbi:MAG: hypothetical protein G01um101472_533 [Parcubacteria group bacterium Gr01-1014_72]|nr:MAG: hypothetical protein G01um101472_533 [Parcubacteria group bacterium Gr01-1014_72]
MSLGMQLSQSPQPSQTHSLELSQAHRLSLRLALIGELWDERYEPQAVCPKCRRALTPTEIIGGFNQDPNDFTTECTGCCHRFPPELVCFGNASRVVLPFFCDSQTLHQLSGKERLSPKQLASEHPAIFRSAVIHHGSVRRAFERIGIRYPFEEIADWKDKVRGFLGRLPDTIIAECVDVSVKVIRLMRRELGIARFNPRLAMEED